MVKRFLYLFCMIVTTSFITNVYGTSVLNTKSEASSKKVSQSAADKLEQRLSHFQSMTADFRQMIRDSNGTVLQESFGKLAIRRPGKFRWEIQKPVQQLILTDGTKIWFYEPDLKQVIIRLLNGSIGETPVMLLVSSNAHLKEKFSITQLPSKNGIERFQLIPNTEDENFNAIVVGFKQELIVMMKLMSQLEQTTELVFSKVSLNVITPTISQRIFSFQIPKGIDVIVE